MTNTFRDLYNLLMRTIENLYNWNNVYFQARSPHVLSNVGRHPRILEVGGGDRILWTTRLSERGETVTVIELEYHKALTASRLAKRPHTKLTNVSWVVADATELPLKKSSFDMALCIDVIEHVPDDIGLLAQIRRVLRIEGLAIVTTMNKNRRHYWKPLIFDNHVREYSFEELASKAGEAGLRVQSSFDFYKPLTTIAREIQLFGFPRSRLPLANLFLNLPLGVLAAVGERSKKLGGGIGYIFKRE